MFEDVLEEAKDGLAPNDLGRVLIDHEALEGPIVVPLQPLEEQNAESVIHAIQNVLNSKQDLDINDALNITVGVIDLPKGAGRKKITKLIGDNNSIHRKRSMVEIVNEDEMCMACAIGVARCKKHKVSNNEWKSLEITGQTMEESILQHNKVPDWYYKDVTKKNRNKQGKLAQLLWKHAKVSTDTPASIM